MPMVTPTLNLPSPATKAATPAVAAAAAVPAPATKAPDAPSTTVTLSPQAISAAYALSHPASTSTSAASSSASDASAPAPAPTGGSVYDSLKNGISTAVTDVGDAIAGGAHAVVEGVETVVSTANKVATGILELPFAAVAKGCDAVGSLIDEF